MMAGAYLCSSEERPNVILIMADDQGWGDMGYQNHPFVQTPHLDEMASKSLVMDRFYAAAPVCSPTRGSVLTGRHPMRINILNHGHYIRSQEVSLADEFKKAGYITGHFGKWHIGSVQKESPVSPAGLGFDEWLTAPNFFDLDPWLSDDGVAKQFKGESSKIIVDRSIQFLEKHQDKPFFTVIWFSSPHSPFPILTEDQNLYPGLKDKLKGYYQEITTMDREIGRFRARLKNLNLMKNTLVWYCSDNGGLNKEFSGGREKKGSIYEGGLRVPCLIEWQGVIEPSRSFFPSVTSDIYPTLMELIQQNISHQHKMDGVSLLPILKGRQLPDRPGMGFWHHFQKGEATWSDKIVKQIHDAQQKGISPAFPYRLNKNIDDFPNHPKDFFKGHAAWTQWPYKLHRIQVKQGERYELYQLDQDPMEEKNLIKVQPEKAKELIVELKEWQASVMHSLNGGEYLNK